MIARTKKPKVIKAKKCRAPGCDDVFFPARPMQKVCSPRCSLKLAEAQRVRKEKAAAAKDRKETKAKLLDMKPRRYWVAALKKSMHLWVRIRDEGKGCISCGKPLARNGRAGGDYDAGHYRSVGSAKHLEFDERNIHAQCKHCNRDLAGNPVAYRFGLAVRLGLAAVEALEADQAPRKYSVEQLKAMRADYDKRVKGLINGVC